MAVLRVLTAPGRLASQVSVSIGLLIFLGVIAPIVVVADLALFLADVAPDFIALVCTNGNIPHEVIHQAHAMLARADHQPRDRVPVDIVHALD